MNPACPTKKLIANLPEFQEIKEHYKNFHYSDARLINAIQLCKQYYGYETDWLPIKPGQKAAFTRFLKYYLRRVLRSQTESDMGKEALIDLYERVTGLYPSKVLENRISMIADHFSGMLDKECDKHPLLSRLEVLRSLGGKTGSGVKVLLKRVFDAYPETYFDVDKRYEKYLSVHPELTEKQKNNIRKQLENQAKEFKKVLDNSDILGALAAVRVGENEGFVVNIKDMQINFDEFNENESMQEGVPDVGEEDNEVDNEETSKGDRYVDFRTAKLMNTLSVRAKRLISKIQRLKANGKPAKDDLGFIQYMEPRQVAVVLNRILVDSEPETLISDLRAAEKQYGWIKGLVDELERNPDAKKTVYNNFKKAESTFLYIEFKNGKYTPKLANSRAQGNALMAEAGSNMSSGFVLDEDYSVYTSERYGGLKSKEQLSALAERFEELIAPFRNTILPWIQMDESSGVVSESIRKEKVAEMSEKYGKDVTYLLNSPAEAMKSFVESEPEFIKELTRFVRGIGFDISEEDIKEMAEGKLDKKSYGFIVGKKAAKSASVKDRNRLVHLIDAVQSVIGSAVAAANAGGTNAYGSYVYGTSTNEMRIINHTLALTKYDEVEARVVNEGKSLSAYNNTNILRQVMNILSNHRMDDIERYRETLDSEFLQYEGFALGKGDTRQLSGWLKDLYGDDPTLRDNLRVYDVAAFNHVEYAKMNRQQKMLNTIVMYLTGVGRDNTPLYEMPIQGDYSTAYNFIAAKRYGTRITGLPENSYDEYDSKKASEGVGITKSDLFFRDSDGKLYTAEIVDNLSAELRIEMERIAAIKARSGIKDRAQLSVYEEQGQKIQIFPELNDNGFIDAYTNAKDDATALDIVKEAVADQLLKVIEHDRQSVVKAGVLSHTAMKQAGKAGLKAHNLYSKDGTIAGMKPEAVDTLDDAFLNIFFAREQVVKLVTGGLEQFNGLIDYEKRNMLSHATHSSVDTTATYKGKRVGKEEQSVVYLADEKAETAFMDDIKQILGRLRDEKLISPVQYRSMLRTYSNITSTDGMGLRTLDSYREIMIMTDQWTDEHESAYNNIIAGHPRREDLDIFMQQTKPVLTGFEHIPAAPGENQKPVKLTVLHKYSEIVLLPEALNKYCLQAKSVPMRGIDKAREALKAEGKTVDLFLFKSGCKVGAHSVIQPFAKDKSTGERILKGSDAISKYIVDTVDSGSYYIHSIPYKYWGIAAATPPHAADDAIARSSQLEKVAWANIKPGDKIVIDGKEMDAIEARDRYYAIKTANIISSYNEVVSMFNNYDKLEKILQEEIAQKAYSSRELKFALTRLKDGTFAVPFFSPGVVHDVEQLLASIVKKRLTKRKTKGVNMLVSTSLGLEVEASPFDEEGMPDSWKLGLVFEGEGKDRHLHHFEVGMPLTDSRLEEFADENGNIGPERLQQLVDDGIIEESALYFVASRTPADAEHSAMPCKIKWFSNKLAGATAKMPKESEVVTGQDFDGDKIRCDFKDFTVGWNTEKIEKAYADYVSGVSDEEYVKMILGKADEMLSYNEFYNYIISDRNPNRAKYRKVSVQKYDYSKKPHENSQTARDNALVELMFAQLSSVEGSRRVLVPGGCDETKIYARSIYLIHTARDAEAKHAVIDAMFELKRNAEEKAKRTGKPADYSDGLKNLTKEQGEKAMRSTNAFYSLLTSLYEDELDDIVKALSGTETPFSFSHSVDAFEYIMGGAELIGIYALYNSAFTMMQRLNLTYRPGVTKKGDAYTVSLFGHKPFGEMFSRKNSRGMLASLSLSRLLNAAVDNNKAPVLGYLNQTKEMAEMTFLLSAVGLDEEEIHLLYNQPAVLELINRLKSPDSLGMRKEIAKLIDSLLVGVPEADANKLSNPYLGVLDAGKISREDYIAGLGLSMDDINQGIDYTAKKNQIALLHLINHLSTPARQLADFVRLTRPETSSGAIGSSVASIIKKKIDLDEFRENLATIDEHTAQILGMEDVLTPKDALEDYDEAYLEEQLQSGLSEVTALNSLMIDNTPELFVRFFPYARRSWIDVIHKIAKAYSYKSIQEGTVVKIANEMVLWKLLSDKAFVGGDPQEEQKRIIVDVPKDLRDLKIRIANAVKNHGTDPAYEVLSNNVFLQKLNIYEPRGSESRPRLQFRLNGPAVEGMKDAISSDWAALLKHPDKAVRDLAVDLFKYNMYTNGFSYGMYEFAHFVPFSVMQATEGFMEALNNVLESDFNSDSDIENFINQYYLNHWGDSKFLKKVPIAKLPNGIREQFGMASVSDTKVIADIKAEQRYIIVTSGENNSVQTLYRIDATPNGLKLVPAVKLGYRLSNGQAILQYNPTVWHEFVKYVVVGNDSAWGQQDDINYIGESNYEAPDATAPGAAYADGYAASVAPTLAIFGVGVRSGQMKKLADGSAAAATKNGNTLPPAGSAPESAAIPFPTLDDENPSGGMPLPMDMELLAAAEIGRSTEDNDISTGKEYYIVRRDEDGKVSEQKVPGTPNNVREARKQQVYAELHRRLAKILSDHGISIGVLSDAEARMSIGGVADFDTATVTAEGMIEMIRIAEGYIGEMALPEEFAHVALEMLGHDHPLVSRLLSALSNNDEALEEAYDGMYGEYAKTYGEDNKDKLVLEATGKLVAKELFRQQELENKPIRRIVHRVVEAIKDFFRKFSRRQIQDAILDANQIASQLARDLLSGRLADQMNLSNIQQAGALFNKTKEDLSGKEDILSKLLKTEIKRAAIFEKRLDEHKRTDVPLSLQRTKEEIEKLRSAIKNHRTEEAVVTYIKDSVQFLTDMHQNMMDTIGAGKPSNVVCRTLNMVRDTLYSFSKSLEDINAAILDKEIVDDVNLTDSIREVKDILSRFYQEYEGFAREYFERMLANIYGEDGITVAIGNERGRVITIHEMATKADKDISLASRWFHSLADCNDYVLKAVDEVTRTAKLNARRRTAAIRPRVEVAMDDLVRETGSRDQSFMFERVLGADGKYHRTGRYISEEESKSLSPARKRFYDEMISIKREIDTFMPDSLVEDRKIVMLRKVNWDRIKGASGIKDKALAAWDEVRSSVCDMSDTIDFDHHEVAVDFEGNRVDRLVPMFMLKGKKESYDDMTEDVASSIMAYAGMAHEYNEIGGVINILENAKYMASERRVGQRTGIRIQRESIETDDTVFHEPFTVKQAKTNLQRVLEDFYQMHLYGHIQKAEGTIGRTRLDKRKLVNGINNVTSLSQMAINLPQRIANVGTGLTQIIIESAGKGVFNMKDVAWASGIWTKESADRLAETGKTDYDNKLSLWMDYFDIHQDNGRDNKNMGYGKSRASHVFNSQLLYAGLTIGEDYLAAVTALAAARNQKVKGPDGKVTNLWDAYEVKYTDPAEKRGAYLALKSGYTNMDGSAIDFEQEKRFSKLCAGLNFELQGIYNLDDRSAVQQYAFGALIIMYRKWIAPALKRRYSAVQYNALKGEYEEGYHRTFARLLYESAKDGIQQVTEEQGKQALWNIIGDMQAICSSIKLNWNNMTPYEKSNVKRSITELAIVVGLYAATYLLGHLPPDEEGNERHLNWLEMSLYAQLMRLRTEIGSQAPTPMLVDEALKILNSPFAAIGPLRDSLNVFQLMVPHNYFVEVKSGRFKGRTKAYKYFRSLPIVSMWKKVDNFIDPSYTLNYYKNGANI